MDFQSAMETFAEAWAAANTVKSEMAADLTQNSDHHQTKTPQHRTAEERVVQHQTSAAIQQERTPLTPQPSPNPGIGDMLPKKEAFNSLLNKNIPGKTLTIHCVVEAISSLEESTWRQNSVVEKDSYVIISASLSFFELVPAAMMRLGYPFEMASSARGFVVISNWKPLSFECISDVDHLVTVGEVLGELTSVATLRIQILRPRPTPLQDIKDKLLRILLLHSRPLLMSSGCPLDDMMLAQICQGQDRAPGSLSFQGPSEDMRRKFEIWWNAQLSPRPSFSPPKNNSPPLNTRPDHLHPALQSVPTQKTRMRTSFDPELELPRLQRWFSENQHPSRLQINHYVKELNSLESRRGRKALDVHNVVYWFKNARAAQKRSEHRSIVGMNCHLGVNGYNSPSHSSTNSNLISSSEHYHNQENMKNILQFSDSPVRYPMSVMSGDILSNAGSDMEEDGGDINADDRPESPEGPLSLITTKKNKDNGDIPQESKEADTVKVDEIKQEPKDLSKPDQENSPRRSPNKNSDSSVNNNNDEENGIADEHDNVSDDEVVQERHYRPTSQLDRLPFPMVANHPMFGHGIMYMSQYMNSFPGVGGVPGEGASGLNLALTGATDERRKRNRTFIDPLTEVPVLEEWFRMNTHPSQNLILNYTDQLNRMPYREKFPRLEAKNVQFWFKNRRAKCKRLKGSLFDNSSSAHYTHPHALVDRKMI